MTEKLLNNNFYYSDQENEDPEIRENRLFSNFSNTLANICSKSSGWNTILSNVNLNEINSRSDLKKIPITRKSSLSKIQSLMPLYGGLTTKNDHDFSYCFSSPGSIYEPGESGDFWNMSSCLYAAGLRKNNLVYNTFSYHLGPAGIMMSNAANKIGCSVIPGGIGNTDIQVSTIGYTKPSFYIGTPSFLKILLERAVEKNINISSLKNGLVGAEPLPNSLRDILKNLGIHVMQMYGIAETGCIAYETREENGSLSEGMVVENNIILEIVRPGTQEALPVGEVGEVVVSKINSSYPMIRLATGDLSCIMKGKSSCGRTNIKIKGWLGRAEQTTKFKGIFVKPEQINLITKHFKEVLKSKLILVSKDYQDVGELICETDSPEDSLRLQIIDFFKDNTKLRVKVKFVEKNQIANDGLVIEDKRLLD